MENEKYEELLQLALEMPADIRERSSLMSTGYSDEKRRWEVIAKYHGDVKKLQQEGIGVEELITGYAILEVPDDKIKELGEWEEIEYLEIPKKYYAQDITPRDAVDANRVIQREPYLTGKGVLVAVLDSGVDYQRREFRKKDGSTRILFYWDQRQEEGFFDEEELNKILKAEGNDTERKKPGVDSSGHGTAVMGIAAGMDHAGTYRGIAGDASLLVVALGSGRNGRNTSYSTDIMRGVKFALDKAQELHMPLIINLSYGSTYGPHNGSALLERYLDNAAEIGKTVIFVGAGNEASAAGHCSVRIRSGEQNSILFSVAEYERDISLQIWKNPGDLMRMELISPGGRSISISRELFEQGGRVKFENCDLICYWGSAVPYRSVQEIYLELQGAASDILTGIWQIILTGERIQNGRVDAYLQGSAVRNRNTFFLYSDPNLTLTSPSAAGRVITVGAYDPGTDSYADFSGRGEEGTYAENILENGTLKPDFLAAGVDMLAPFREEGYTAVTGTSFSTPLAAGCGALLMEWGIVRNQSPFLYGEKMKAALRASTKRLQNMQNRPDNKNGYGGLVIFDDFVENI